MPEGLTQLGTYGLVGVMLALIGLVVIMAWILYKIVGNHISHSTETMGEVKEVLVGIRTLLDERLKK